MRIALLVCITVFFVTSCKNEGSKKDVEIKPITKVNYQSFGKEILAIDAIKAPSMAAHYKTMSIGDSVPSKMRAKVTGVCKAKGCWMTLDLEDGNEVMVKFKDYGFFVPKDIEGKQVIINGKAYIKEVPVEELRHYAKDAGESPEKIASIINPERTLSFEADGVLLKP
ncbi:hypothetical protein GCM10022291_04020 [Postechiella marina]|uniref:DUF4920 domain-containing protein n=1 Tax=Postechiella marina TaxID=943941 RepID=A0ABP8C0S1_9FLAO